MNLRTATLLDAEIVYRWRNAVETRLNCFDSQPLEKNHHMKWFKKSLDMPNRSILIASLNERPVGVLRYDFNHAHAEVNIFLCPQQIGQGLGTKMIIVGSEWIKLNHPEIKSLTAKILTHNIASKRAFEKAGFELKIQTYEKVIAK